MGPIAPAEPLPIVVPPRELGPAPGRPSLCCNSWSVIGGLIGTGIANAYQPPIPWTVSEKIMISCLAYMVGMHVGNGFYRVKEFYKNYYPEEG